MVGICKSRYLKKNIELLTSTPPIIMHVEIKNSWRKNHNFNPPCRSGEEEKPWD